MYLSLSAGQRYCWLICCIKLYRRLSSSVAVPEPARSCKSKPSATWFSGSDRSGAACSASWASLSCALPRSKLCLFKYLMRRKVRKSCPLSKNRVKSIYDQWTYTHETTAIAGVDFVNCIDFNVVFGLDWILSSLIRIIIMIFRMIVVFMMAKTKMIMLVE